MSKVMLSPGTWPRLMASCMVFVVVAYVLFSVGVTAGFMLGALAASLAVWGGLSRDSVAMWAAAAYCAAAALLAAASWYWNDIMLWARGG